MVWILRGILFKTINVLIATQMIFRQGINAKNAPRILFLHKKQTNALINLNVNLMVWILRGMLFKTINVCIAIVISYLMKINAKNAPRILFQHKKQTNALINLNVNLMELILRGMLFKTINVLIAIIISYLMKINAKNVLRILFLHKKQTNALINLNVNLMELILRGMLFKTMNVLIAIVISYLMKINAKNVLRILFLHKKQTNALINLNVNLMELILRGMLFKTINVLIAMVDTLRLMMYV